MGVAPSGTKRNYQHNENESQETPGEVGHLLTSQDTKFE
jgi:hypothetical protein